jgi:predicted ATPase
MKIKNFSVSGLNKRLKFDFDFHDDFNIFTGINGSGKTTALKLAWYIISGATVRVRNEIEFKTCALTTDTFRVEMERIGKRDISYSFESFIGREKKVSTSFDAGYDLDSDGDVLSDGEDALRDLIREVSESSIFFPTFRRLEGGYSLGSPARRVRFPSFGVAATAEVSIGSQLEQLSKDLSSGQHKFVCSISTDDIAALLTQRYAYASEEVNRKYTEFSGEILDGIRSWEQAAFKGDRAEKLLLDIQSQANEVDSFRESALRPFNVLSDLVSTLFSYQGVKLKGLPLGDAAKAIDSDVLSAGEKQMLSFLVYNAFAVQSPIFIDEPELSLHPDWQRRLFPTLMDQQSSNQFIISTHSPFIYSKYADKELSLNRDRGD